MKKEIRAILLLLWSAILILGCIIFHLFFSIYQYNQNFAKESILIKANITEIKKNSDKFIPTYDHYLKYKINDKEYEGIITKLYKLNKGQVEIFYHDSNSLMEKNGVKNQLLVLIISSIFPLFALMNIINIFYNICINYRIKKRNNVVIVPISKIKKNKSHWFPYKLECIYNGQVYETIMTAEHNFYINYNNINKVKLYLAKSNYYIDIDSLYEMKEG